MIGIVPDLVRLLEEHRASPFPPEARGEEYGEVDAVMIDADIYGWCSTAASTRLSEADRQGLQRAHDELVRSLPSFPTQVRPYYERLQTLAEAALAGPGVTRP
jgi:hypothetical protein